MDTESGSDGREGTSGGVPDILVGAVNIGSHRGDHVGETGSFREVGYNFTALDTGVVVFVDNEGFDDNENSDNVRSDEIVEFVECAVNVLNKWRSWSPSVQSIRRGRILLKRGPASNSRASISKPWKN